MEDNYNNKKLIIRIFKDLFKPYYIVISICILFIIISILYTVIPKVTGQTITLIYNQVINKVAYEGVMNFEKIKKICIYMLLIYLLFGVLSHIRNMLIIKICKNYIKELRIKIYSKILILPIRFFNNTNNGMLLSLVTNDIENINYYIINIIRETFTEFLNIIGACIMIYTINPILFFINNIIMIICIVFITIIIKISQRYFNRRQEIISILNDNVEEAYTNYSLTSIYNNFKMVQYKFDCNNKDLRVTSIKAEFISSLASTVLSFTENIAIALTAILSAYLIIKGQIEIGLIYTIISYTTTIIKPFSKIGSIVNEFTSALSSSKRIYKFIDQSDEDIKKDDVKEFHDKLLIDAIKFSYNYKENVIKNISMKINKGKKIAIVGKTGSGKTTLAKLLMNIYNVNDGKIEIDAVNINNYNNIDYLDNFSLICQDINLFQDTIMENIKYGNEKITNEEIIDYAIKFEINDVFTSLENGYDTIVSEDNISNGIKQLIVLLRCIVSNTNVLIFDEATNMLNGDINRKIQNGLKLINKNKTLIVIAHNLETIIDSDMIYVLDEGRIVEFGKHDELIKNNSLYAKMISNKK